MSSVPFTHVEPQRATQQFPVAVALAWRSLQAGGLALSLILTAPLWPVVGLMHLFARQSGEA